MKLYYDKDGIQLWHGDCRENTNLPGDCAITDPPYNFGKYAEDNEAGVTERLKMWKRKAVFGYPEVLVGWCMAWGVPDEWVTWWPTNKTGGRCGKKLPRTTEAIAIWGELNELPTRDRKNPNKRFQTYHEGKYGYEQKKVAYEYDVWRDAAPGMAFNSHLRKHPNEKPIALMEKLVRLCSQPGELVCDPYAGSGTTLLACQRNGRRAIGVELNEKHCETAAKRLSEELTLSSANVEADTQEGAR